jgi:hypothetical protein
VGLLLAVYENIDLLVIKRDQSIDRRAFKIRISVPPDDVFNSLLRRDLDVVIMRVSLEIHLVSVRPVLDV